MKTQMFFPSYEEIGDVLKDNHIQKYMVVGSGIFNRLPVKRYLDGLGIPYVLFSDFVSNPTYESVVKAVKLYNDTNCQMVISVGGGSAIDVGKCIKLFALLPEGTDYLTAIYVENNAKFLAYPTTAGTGSESTHFAVIYYQGNKKSVEHDSMLADYVVLDSSALAGLPLPQKKSTLLDALCQAIESWWSVNSDDKSKALSAEAIQLIMANWKKYLAGDESTLEPMLKAANLAGQAINITKTTAAHAMSYKLTSLYGVAHGHAVAICLPKIWRYMNAHMEKTPNRSNEELLKGVFLNIANAMGCASVDNAIDKFENMLKSMEMTVPEVDEEGLEMLASSVNADRLANNPVKLDGFAIREIYADVLGIKICWLPGNSGEKVLIFLKSNAMVIIGANGAGKSKLGAWIEQQDFERVHRIAAQRSLNFNEDIMLKNYSQAEEAVFYGSSDSNQKKNKWQRWNGGQGEAYTTKLIDDFENVLAALIALKNNQHDEFVEKCKAAENEGKDIPHTTVTVIDKLQQIWNEIFPQRKLRINDSKFYAVQTQEGKEQIYAANQMSDGERSVLYLVAQVLCVPQQKILIMDEPELHLHRSIMNKLWITLEKFRPDCLFVYITHDTQFAAMHSHAGIIWVREYDGANWKWQKIDGNELPEELLLDILGSRKNVLFVEGEKNSFDTQLYTILFPNFYIIACGSCSQVIARTKVFKNNPQLHNCIAYGIIDRDYRSEHEIEMYKQDNIFTLQVAEVENLFVVEELVRFMARHQGKDNNAVFDMVKEFVIRTKFQNMINKQICQSVVAQIKYKLSSAEISMKNDKEAKASLDNAFHSINYDTIKSEQEKRFNDALESKNYLEILKIFNEKGIAKSIGTYFGIENRSYCAMVIDIMRGEKRDDMVALFSKYLPEELMSN